ncbi:MAG: DUF4292 domain-containing protein [Candidatus Kryptoniota bacterium]
MSRSLLFLGLLIAGCATTYTYMDLSSITPQSVAGNIESQSRLFESFSSSGYGNFETPQGDYSARFDISIRKPSPTYVRIYGPFGMKVAQIKLSSDTIIVYNSFLNELYVGKPTADNLRRFLMIAPDGSSVTNILLGLVSPPAIHDSSRISSNVDGRSVSFTYNAGDTVERYSVDGKYMRTTDYEESIDGEAVMRIRYSDFTNVGNVYFPKSVSFEDTRRKISAKLFYQDIELSENDDLEFTAPADAKEIFLN